MKRPPLPYLLLLPLLAVLLFSNCGGGVNRFLRGLEYKGRLARLDSLVRQRRQLRHQTRQQLHGPARRAELDSIDERTNAQIQALLRNDWERRKVKNRRHKIERHLRYHLFPTPPLASPR